MRLAFELVDWTKCLPNVCLCVCVLVAQSCPTLCDAMDCSPRSSSVHGILQARILEWVAIPFSTGYSWSRGWTRKLLHRMRPVYCLSRQGSLHNVGEPHSICWSLMSTNPDRAHRLSKGEFALSARLSLSWDISLLLPSDSRLELALTPSAFLVLRSWVMNWSYTKGHPGSPAGQLQVLAHLSLYNCRSQYLMRNLWRNLSLENPD